MSGNDLVAKLQREVDELKAHNDALLDELYAHADNAYCSLNVDIDLSKTPSQCLAQVKHDAIIEAANATKEQVYGMVNTYCTCVSSDLEEYATNLLAKEQAQC